MNISGYIPSRLRTQVSFPERSFEEMAWGPSLMMAKEDKLRTKVSDLDAALDFEYSEKDDPYIAPKLEGLRGELDTLQDEIVKGGYNPLLEQKMLNFRRKYQKELGPHGDIGRARKNYAAMQSALQEYDKNHAKDPEWFRQKAKQNIVNTYQGMYDDYGKYREFTPGQATGYRDINADFVDFATKSGMQGGLQELASGNLQIVPTTINGQTYLKTIETTPGYVSSNKGNLEALLNQFVSEYNDPNTDRGIFAGIAGLTPDKIGQALGNMAGLTYKEQYAKQPTWNAGLQHVPNEKDSDKKTTAGGWGFPTYSNELPIGTNKEFINLREDIKDIKKRVATNELKKNIPESLANQEIQDIAYKMLAGNPNMGMDVALKAAKVQFEKTPSGKAKIFSDLKKEYSNLLLPNMSDEAFLDKIDKHLEEREANTSRLKSLDSEDAIKFLETNIGLDNDQALTRIKKGDHKGPENTSFAEFRKTFSSETALGRKQVFYDENLNTYIQDAENNVYKVNKDLSDINPIIKQEHKQLKTIATRNNLTKDEINAINNTPVKTVPGDNSNSHYAIRIGRDASGNLIKQVKLWNPNPETGQYDEQVVSLDEFVNNQYPNKAMKIIFTDLSKYNK